MALEAFAKTTSDSVIVPISLRMTLTLAPLKKETKTYIMNQFHRNSIVVN